MALTALRSALQLHGQIHIPIGPEHLHVHAATGGEQKHETEFCHSPGGDNQGPTVGFPSFR
jgi:hypothetical protein